MKKIWVVVLVERGFITSVKPFRKKKEAKNYYSKHKVLLNPDYDEIEIFHMPLPN